MLADVKPEALTKPVAVPAPTETVAALPSNAELLADLGDLVRKDLRLEERCD